MQIQIVIHKIIQFWTVKLYNVNFISLSMLKTSEYQQQQQQQQQQKQQQQQQK